MTAESIGLYLPDVRPDVGPIFVALADPTRRAILESVRGGPRSVGDIAADFAMSRPAISQHLLMLKEAGLLRSQRSGRQNFYGLDLAGLSELRSYVDGFWDEVLGAFQSAAIAESARRERRGPK